MVIQIKVTDNIASVVSRPKHITAGTVGLPVEFTFDSHWNGLNKTAVFEAGCNRISVPLVDNSTVVPMAVLSAPAPRLNIGVYGTDGTQAIAIPTIWASVGSVKPGATPGSHMGYDPGIAKKYLEATVQAASDAIEAAKRAEAVEFSYTTEREVLEIGGVKNSVEKADAEYIWGLYDALQKEYGDDVVKKTDCSIGDFKQWAYEISTREYPTDGLYAEKYEADPQIKKPKYLILSGIHGDERKNCLSTYRFIRDVLKGVNVPKKFREGVTLCVMPVGNPSGINAFTRLNANGVDINRDFEAVDPENETLAIKAWLQSHPDADLFIDFHNNGQINEQVVIMGLEDMQKKIAMRGIDRVIPFWRDVIGYPKDMTYYSVLNNEAVTKDVIFSYTATADIPGAHCYAQKALGIDSLAIETSVFYPDENFTHQAYVKSKYMLCPPETIAMGAEALGNILIEMYAQEDMTMPYGAPIYNGEAVLNIDTKTHTRYTGEVE